MQQDQDTPLHMQLRDLEVGKVTTSVKVAHMTSFIP